MGFNVEYVTALGSLVLNHLLRDYMRRGPVLNLEYVVPDKDSVCWRYNCIRRVSCREHSQLA